MSRTFIYKNRHGVEVQVAEEHARFLHNNPSMEYIGELVTKKVVKPIKKTRTVEKEFYKYETIDGNKKRVPFTKEVEEEYEETDVVIETILDNDTVPEFSGTETRSDGTIEVRASLTKSGQEKPGAIKKPLK